MALFAAKRLNKLSTKLRTIDNVLPNDDFSNTLNTRQKRFVDFLFAPAIIDATRKHCNASLQGDLFDKKLFSLQYIYIAILCAKILCVNKAFRMMT